MERLIDYEFERTRYLVWHPRAWGFYVSVAVADGDAIHLDLDFLHRKMPGLQSPRRFEMPEGVDMELVVDDGDAAAE